MNEKKRLDVSLIVPPTRAHTRRPPSSFLTLAAFLEQEGHSTEIVDFKVPSYTPLQGEALKKIENQVIQHVSKQNPAIVGLTCMSHEVDDVLELGKRIKEKSGAKIVVGGPHSNNEPQDLLFKNTPIDGVVIGEGELTFEELVKRVKDGSDWQSTKSIAYWNGEQLVRTPKRELMDLDRLPIPAFEKIDMNYYTQPHVYAIRYLLLSSFYVFSSRGCPWNCNFCSFRTAWDYNANRKPIRYRSVKNVVDEIELLVKKYHVDAVYMYDDDFCIWKKRVLEFAEELEKRELNILWACETRVDEVSDEMLSAMKHSGCIQLDFGVESGSQRSLDAVNKQTSVEDARNAFRMCHKQGIRTFANFMFNTPNETEEDVAQTMKFAKEIQATEYSFGIMTPYAGSELYKELSINMTPEDLESLKEAEWVLNPKFVVAKHKLDLSELVAKAMIQLNSPLNQLRYPDSIIQYVKKLSTSRKKGSYLNSMTALTSFAIKSRIPRLLAKNLSPYK